jgi:hypothetical protein
MFPEGLACGYQSDVFPAQRQDLTVLMWLRNRQTAIALDFGAANDGFRVSRRLGAKPSLRVGPFLARGSAISSAMGWLLDMVRARRRLQAAAGIEYCGKMPPTQTLDLP